MAATYISIGALVLSAVALIFTWKSADASVRSAKTAEASDHRARTPQLAILLDVPEPAPNDRVIYRIRNDGPQGLDSLIMYRPKPPNGITYPLAVTGRTEWMDDEIELGPLGLGEENRFTLCCSSTPELPEFRVLIRCTADVDVWETSAVLPSPRGI